MIQGNIRKLGAMVLTLLLAVSQQTATAASEDGPFRAKAAADANYTALWWNPAEAGWGLNINHQGNTLFATLFTYDSFGSPMWLVMSNGAQQADGTFSGDLFRTTGPRFDAIPFRPITAANLTKVGSMTLSFAGANSATVEYLVNGSRVRKTIERQVFGSAAATCQSTQSARNSLTNYQDLWWNPAESGWGVNITHQDNILFATLFTYDEFGQGLWLVMSSGQKQADGSFSGDLYRTVGSPFDSQPFTPIGPSNLTKVGSMRFAFSDGVNGVMTYTVNGTTVSKAITRQVFGSSAPACASAPPPPAPGTVNLCRSSDSFFSTGCSAVSVPYVVSGTMTATVLGATTVTLDTLTITAVGGPLSVTSATATDDSSVAAPFFSGISTGQTIQAGQSVTFSLVSSLTGNRQANLHFVLRVNGSTTVDARYLLRTN